VTRWTVRLSDAYRRAVDISNRSWWARSVRVRSAAVIVRDQSLLVIERVEDGRRYCVLPGGGVEEGESLRRACERELLEETGLKGRVGDLLDVPVNIDVPAFYFNVQVRSATVTLGGPELERASGANQYEPKWADVDSLAQIPLLPDEARRAVQLVLNARSPDR
jgi:8-oxo-dGTP diphosphatase